MTAELRVYDKSYRPARVRELRDRARELVQKSWLMVALGTPCLLAICTALRLLFAIPLKLLLPALVIALALLIQESRARFQRARSCREEADLLEAEHVGLYGA